MKFINFDDIVSKNENNYINKNVFSLNTQAILLLLDLSDAQKQI